jgi:peptide chain release factor 1
MEIENKLDNLVEKFQELESRMSKQEVASNPEELQKLAKEHSDLAPIVGKYREYRSVLKDIGEAKEMLHANDEEMHELAREELEIKQTRLEEIEEELKMLLVPKDPHDEKSVIVEIRAGAGGDEAALFASDLFRMYTRFAERQGWKIEVMNTSESGIGGYKEIAFRIDGRGAYSMLKYESGVHRVQRVPVTESGGRIHTSTATVAVLPEVEDVDVEVRTEDLRIDTYRASGAGGQHVNMTDSAVRITHLPSGVVVTCQDERSQLKNKVRAMHLLKTKLYDLELRKQEQKQASARKSQVGSGDRSERIRTYNYPQNRITDHRIGLTLHKMESFLDGDIFEMIDALSLADQAERVQQIDE